MPPAFFQWQSQFEKFHPCGCVNTAAWGAVWQFGWLTRSHEKNILEGVFPYTWLMSVVWSEGTTHSREDTKLEQE